MAKPLLQKLGTLNHGHPARRCCAPRALARFWRSGRMEQINQAITSILKPLEAVLYIVGKACQLVRAEAMLHLMILIATKVTTATWPQKTLTKQKQQTRITCDWA